MDISTWKNYGKKNENKRKSKEKKKKLQGTN